MSVSDMSIIESQVDDLVDEFRDLMIQTFEEEPHIFEGRNTKENWFSECQSAKHALTEEINKAIEKIETRLHNGEYS
jgi:hypothetical protein